MDCLWFWSLVFLLKAYLGPVILLVAVQALFAKGWTVLLLMSPSTVSAVGNACVVIIIVVLVGMVLRLRDGISVVCC